MPADGMKRRTFLTTALAGGAVAAGCTTATTVSAPDRPVPPVAWQFLTPAEGAFVVAMVDHMIPADDLSPSGTDVGVHVYIDRALASSWGKGERLYLQGPWKSGTANQGYQLPHSPAQLYRLGIAATDAYCVKEYGRPFAALGARDREAVLSGLDSGSISLEGGLPAKTFFELAYRTVMEGFFSDPIHGGNRGKAGWKMIGFPGAPGAYRQHVAKFRDRPYRAEPRGIGDNG